MTFKKSLWIIVAAEILVLILAIMHYGITLEGLQATTRFSGRLSLAIFSLMFILLPASREKLFNLLSPQPFLIFAIAHGIHLGELLSYVYLSKAQLIPIRLAGGFLAYTMIFTLPVVQYYAEAKKLSVRQYIAAENIYLCYVWFIFFMSYLPRVQGKLPHVGGSYQEFVVLLFWVCLLAGIKLVNTLTPKRKRQ